MGFMPFCIKRIHDQPKYLFGERNTRLTVWEVGKGVQNHPVSTRFSRQPANIFNCFFNDLISLSLVLFLNVYEDDQRILYRCFRVYRIDVIESLTKRFIPELVRIEHQ